MDYLNNEIIIKKIEKLERLKQQQREANKRYYDKNKENIIKNKVGKYAEKTKDDLLKEKNRANYKLYYQKNKEIVKLKNLERYHNKKNQVELPILQN